MPVLPPVPSPPPLLGLGLTDSSLDASAWLRTPVGLSIVIGVAVVTLVIIIWAAVLLVKLFRRHPRLGKRAKTMPGRSTVPTRASYDSSMGGSWRASSQFGGTVRFPGIVRTSHASTADGCSPASSRAADATGECYSPASSRADATADGCSPASSRGDAFFPQDADDSRISSASVSSPTERGTSPFHSSRVGVRAGSNLRFAGGVRTVVAPSPASPNPGSGLRLGGSHHDATQTSAPDASLSLPSPDRGDSGHHGGSLDNTTQQSAPDAAPSCSSPDLHDVVRLRVPDAIPSPPSPDGGDRSSERDSLKAIVPIWTPDAAVPPSDGSLDGSTGCEQLR
jgi:hypothetical protein